MLEAKHIVSLKLDRSRYAAHQEMPMPRYVSKPLIGQFSVISDAVITALLGMDPSEFKAQLDTARQLGAEYVAEDIRRNPIGISATTSLIKSGDIIGKNIIVPCNLLHYSRKLSDHCIIAAFVKGSVQDGLLQNVEDVEVAGWASAHDILRWKVPQLPPNFQTKLPVVMMPVAMLRPVDELIDRVQTASLCP